MTTITTSKNAIVQVNKALLAILQHYLDPNGSAMIDIRFDLPAVNSAQSSPTVSIFLYDLHEDLQLRQSEAVRLNVKSATLRPGWVHLNCNYLITYWEPQEGSNSGDGPNSSPDNQSVQVTTKILQALLNNRELEGIAGAYTRIIPPQENLNSLGNFWQSLGNRPRLSLFYSVTVPIALDTSESLTLVKTVSSTIMPRPAIELQKLNQHLRHLLSEQMEGATEQALTRLELTTEPSPLVLPSTLVAEQNRPALEIVLTVSGLVDKSYQQSLMAVLERWQENQQAVTTIDNLDIYLTDIQADGIVYL